LGGPALAFPRRTGTRLEIGNFGIGLKANSDEVSAKLIFDRSALILASDDPDSFVASLFPADGIRVDFDLALGFDFVERQFFLGTAAKLEVVIPISKPLGPLTILHVTIRLGAPEGDDEQREVALRLAFSFKLFAVTGVVDQIGFRAAFRATETGGRLGLIDRPEFGFVPPKGIGLNVKAASVRGGGFVFFDSGNDGYAGVLSLEVFGWSIKVVGLIKTNLGTSPDFSLLLIGSVEGLEIALPAGGLLTGIGLVLGMHRTISVEAFQAGIKNRTLDAILFPKDPVANAPQLLQTLKTVFPTAPDQWIVGLNLQAAWLNKNIVKIEIGVLFEFPSPFRVALVGQASLALPTKKSGLVQVNLDVIGILDVDAKFLSIDSVLYDSRIGTYPLSGGMAVRARWGDKPDGVGALGGLHPRFPLPEGFPKLDRLALTIGKGQNPRIRGLAYIGITSNTFQFGLRAEFYAGAGGFSVEGDIGIDLLFQFDPFRFLAELNFRAAVKYKDTRSQGCR
jgi:hypothetical protein